MNKKILVVAAHPDDEILGCGATMAKHIKNGDEVSVLILAEGITSRDPKRNRNASKNDLTALKRASINANKLLGVHLLTHHDFPDNRMDTSALLDVIKTIESHIDKTKPEIIYTHFAGDLNIDHRIVNQAVVTACRPMPSQIVKTLLFFEVPSSTEWQINGFHQGFSPNWLVDVSDTIHLKMDALAAYKSELRPWPHARSLKAVEHLARWRGANIGVEAAEAFSLGRNIL